jgi:hypothetical protein
MTESNTTTAMDENKEEKTASTQLPPIVWNVETVPEAYVRDKYQKNYNFATMNSWLDIPNKRVGYEVMLPGSCDPDHKTIYVTFDEICKEFGWKSFELINNDETIKPKW